jgi:hypothetical protein
MIGHPCPFYIWLHSLLAEALRSSVLPWVSDVLCAMTHIHSPKTGVCCLRYVASRGRVKAQDGYLPPF